LFPEVGRLFQRVFCPQDNPGQTREDMPTLIEVDGEPDWGLFFVELFMGELEYGPEPDPRPRPIKPPPRRTTPPTPPVPERHHLSYSEMVVRRVLWEMVDLVSRRKRGERLTVMYRSDSVFVGDHHAMELRLWRAEKEIDRLRAELHAEVHERDEVIRRLEIKVQFRDRRIRGILAEVGKLQESASVRAYEAAREAWKTDSPERLAAALREADAAAEQDHHMEVEEEAREEHDDKVRTLKELLSRYQGGKYGSDAREEAKRTFVREWDLYLEGLGLPKDMVREGSRVSVPGREGTVLVSVLVKEHFDLTFSGISRMRKDRRKQAIV
jgi:hypothetical protein